MLDNIFSNRKRNSINDEVRDEEIPTTAVDLPSSGVFYPNTEGTVHVNRSLSCDQVMQLYGIRSINNEYNKKRELFNVIGRSIHGMDFLDLTLPDFQYLMYWLRLNTYKKSPFMVEWDYTPEGETEKKTVNTRVFLDNFDLTVIDRHRTFAFSFMTVRTYLDTLLLEKEEDVFGAKYARHIREGETIEDKLEILRRKPADFMLELRDFELEAAHGVSPTVLLTDPDNPSAGPFRYNLNVEVEDFFPS